MKKRLSREKDDRGRVITIPNLLSLLRLCLIPVIVWLYLVRGNQFAAGCLMVLSGLTDVMDGRIARRFHMVSDLGKALDPIAESDLYRKYSRMTEGRSSVFISHRLASTRFCDRILLIENAGIREEGTHEELLRLGGRYAELYAVQSKYYRRGECENE